MVIRQPRKKYPHTKSRLVRRIAAPKFSRDSAKEIWKIATTRRVGRLASRSSGPDRGRMQKATQRRQRIVAFPPPKKQESSDLKTAEQQTKQGHPSNQRADPKKSVYESPAC